ncbi:MAG: DUF2723 domain-containing protein, partial [Deltaproteobacteria bacterium]|nr:DUF2723 domain-containing protein [Deltaproteobacteria bacterium]
MFLFLAFIIPFAIYLFTVSPSPFWLDSPELIASSHILGIPHPPGNPLYILPAKFASLIPIGSVPFRINLLSALFGALSAAVLFLMIRGIGRERRSGGFLTDAVSFLVSTLFSVTYGIWIQSVNAEVYTLNLFMNLTAFYMLISGHGDSRRAIAAFFIFG